MEKVTLKEMESVVKAEKKKMCVSLSMIDDITKKYAESNREYQDGDIVQILTNPDFLVNGENGMAITDLKIRYARVTGVYTDFNNEIKYYLNSLDENYNDNGYTDYLGINERIIKKIDENKGENKIEINS